MNIKILPVSTVSKEVLAELSSALPFHTQILPWIKIPANSYNQTRAQYLAICFLEKARKFNNIVLAVTDVDIYAEGLNFIFGQAEISGKAAVISIFRLHHADKKIFISRMVKEAVHELGHVFGLEHCKNKFCVMRFSNCIEDTDVKKDWYCEKCEKKIKNKMMLYGAF